VERMVVQPVAASVEHAGVVARLTLHPDRRSGACEDDPVRSESLTWLDRQRPTLVVADFEPDDLADEHLRVGPLGDLPQVALHWRWVGRRRPRSTQSAYAPWSARCRCQLNAAISAVTAEDAAPQLAA